MKTYLYPSIETWESLSVRPTQDYSTLMPVVRDIVEDVRINGDVAVRRYTQQFDGADLGTFKLEVPPEVQIDPDVAQAIQQAKSNIERFHRSQMINEPVVETLPGVKCWRKSLPIEKVGLYIPGGTAPLFSSLLMLAIPAKLAGCKEIVICSPPEKDGTIHPAIMYTAKLLSISTVYAVGGVQAISAMAIGTETVPQVHKIFGPGNQYVTVAKQLVQEFGVAIDMPAGPSEVLIVADDSSDPSFVAADLLSQAEHGPDSQVILATNSEVLVSQVLEEIELQLKVLPREEIAKQAIANSLAIVLADINEAMAFSNVYAPEHLIINTRTAIKDADHVVNAGSVFLGPWSCESLGDYASGTNHTLPTNRYARNYSGVSMDSFVKKVTFQHINSDGLRTLGPIVEVMAATEKLEAHKNAVSLRLKALR